MFELYGNLWHVPCYRWIMFGKFDATIGHLWKSSYDLVQYAFGDVFDQVGWDLHLLLCDSVYINIIYSIGQIICGHRFFDISMKMYINGVFSAVFLFVGFTTVKCMKLHAGDRESCLHVWFIFLNLLFFLYPVVL